MQKINYFALLILGFSSLGNAGESAHLASFWVGPLECSYREVAKIMDGIAKTPGVSNAMIHNRLPQSNYFHPELYFQSSQEISNALAGSLDCLRGIAPSKATAESLRANQFICYATCIHKDMSGSTKKDAYATGTGRTKAFAEAAALRLRPKYKEECRATYSPPAFMGTAMECGQEWRDIPDPSQED